MQEDLDVWPTNLSSNKTFLFIVINANVHLNEILHLASQKA